MEILMRDKKAVVVCDLAVFEVNSPKELWTLVEQLSDPIIRSGMVREKLEQPVNWPPSKGRSNPEVDEYIKSHGVKKLTPGSALLTAEDKKHKPKITLADLEISL